jgi:hypothetical protein
VTKFARLLPKLEILFQFAFDFPKTTPAKGQRIGSARIALSVMVELVQRDAGLAR